ncbi:hypothetical protein [Arthrobacter sp. FW306-07-I]|uniref:hypothetical protein n=1 Tax=Arthrobacter sp. FW306-07-I TaxID=2879622 RepID=UPI001F17EF8B|nr:hypothetical protein [Arthrobacter sp. FW306-07-I]UKA77325.1 hypothetical protein LFT46_10050 [Arthrobacter sp. FW306-07-I]
MALFSVVRLMALPKSGGDAATWTVIGLVMASSVFAMAAVLLRGQDFGVKWVRHTARWRYFFVGICALFGIAAAIFEPQLSFAYYPAFAAMFVMQIFREERPDSDRKGIESSHRQRLAFWSGVLFAGSVGGMVWTVLAILADEGAPILMAMLVSVLLWSGGILTAARFYGFRSGKRDMEQGDVLNL